MLDLPNLEASEGNFALILHGARSLDVRVDSRVDGGKSLLGRSPGDVELGALGGDDRDRLFEVSRFCALEGHADDRSDCRFAHQLSEGLRSHGDRTERHGAEGAEHWDVLKCAGGRQISRANYQLYFVFFQRSSDSIQTKYQLFAELGLVLLLVAFRVRNLGSLGHVFQDRTKRSDDLLLGLSTDRVP